MILPSTWRRSMAMPDKHAAGVGWEVTRGVVAIGAALYRVVVSEP